MRALVLSAGGSRSALQAGALPVLLDAGLRFDLVVGASVGALNAVFLTADPTPRRARQLADLWQRLRPSDVVAGGVPARLWNAARRRDHLYSPTALRRLIGAHVPFGRLEDAAVRTIVAATDLTTGAERRYDAGPVVDLVAASTAIPGMFPPVAYDGELLIDGGVAAPIPVCAAVDAGAEELWVLDVAQPCTERRPPRSFLDPILQAAAIQQAARTRAYLDHAAGRATIHYLMLPCRTQRSFTDLNGTAELLADGAAATARYLDTNPRREGEPRAQARPVVAGADDG